MDNKDILERIDNIYHFTQYGKLVPGLIHNLNGKITLLDTRIQLAAMGVKTKMNKLEEKRESFGEEEFQYFEKDLAYIKKIVDSLNSFREEVNTILSDLNIKVFNENSSETKKVELKSTLEQFHTFFQFYKYYKHNLKVEFEIISNDIIHLTYKELYFILYVIAKNLTDAVVEKRPNEGKILYRTLTLEDGDLSLQILGNGTPIDVKTPEELILTTTKSSFNSSGADGEKIYGEGLDLFFLQRMMREKNIEWSIIKENDFTGFNFIFKK